MKLPTALPRLTGRWLAAYRVIWCVLALAGLFSATGGMWLLTAQTDRQSLAAYGVGLRIEANGLAMRLGPLGEPAAQAGVVPGSELLAIDGEPASWGMSGIDAATRRLEGPEGSTVSVTLREPGGETRDVVLTRSPDHLRAADAIAPMPYAARSMVYWVMNTVLGLLALATAGLLFWRRPSDPVGALFSVAFLITLVGYALVPLAPPALLEPIVDVVGAVSSACLVVALLTFPNGRFDTRWSWFGVAVLPLVLIWNQVRPDGASAFGMLISVGMFGLCAVAIGRRFLKAAPGVERQQIKWTLLGVVLFLAINTASNGVGMAVRDADDTALRLLAIIVTNVLSTVAVACLLGGLLISILRHRLYDADTAISRSVSAGALTLAVVAVFAGAEKAIEVFGEQYLGGSLGNMAGALAAGLAAAVILPLHHGLSRWSERRFQGALVRMRKHLPHDMDEMRDADTVACLSETAMRHAMAGVRASSGAVLVREGDAWAVAAQSEPGAVAWRPGADEAGLRLDRRDPAWPLRLALPAGGGAIAGWLLVGPRPDGTLPGKDEREALEAIAEPVGRAIRVAQRREQDAAAARARFERLEASVRSLKRRLGGQAAPA
jgi:hypothetical protein